MNQHHCDSIVTVFGAVQYGVNPTERGGSRGAASSTRLMGNLPLTLIQRSSTRNMHRFNQHRADMFRSTSINVVTDGNDALIQLKQIARNGDF
jgi:hypothetical protein